MTVIHHLIMDHDKIAEQVSITEKVAKTYLKVISKFSKDKASNAAMKLYMTPRVNKTKNAQEAFYANSRSRKLNVTEKQYVVYEVGKGPSVLLIHGWNSQAYYLRNIASYLADSGFRVVYPDMPAHGQSDGVQTNIREFSNFIEILLEREPIEYIIGHSFGGAAIFLTLDRLRNSNYKFFKQIKKVVGLSLPSTVEAMVEPFVHIMGLSEELRNRIRSEVEEIAEVPYQQISASNMENTIKDLSLLLFHDEDDEVVSIYNSLLMVNQYPNVELEITSNLGHLGYLKNLEIFEKISNHLKS